MEELKAAIIESHKYREKQEQKEVVIQAAREFLNAIMDGDSLAKSIGAQTRLESALFKLDSLEEEV